MTISSAARVSFGLVLILCGVVAIVAFGVWQSALSGLSPDGAVTDYSWLALRIMLMSLVAPGIVLLKPDLVTGSISRVGHWLLELRANQFLAYSLITAVVLRVVVVLLMPLRLISDFAAYDELAMSLATRGAYVDGLLPTAYFPPGWPFFLALIYKLFGHHPQLGIVANIGFGAATVVLTWLLVRRIWGELPARWAAVIVAVIPCELLFTNILGSEGLFTALLLLALVVLLPSEKSGGLSMLRALAGGAVLGLATLTRSLTLLLPVVLVVVYVIKYGASWRTASRWLACVVGILIVVVPWIVRNEARVGRPTISTNSGVNLYVGNNPNAGVGFNMPDPDVVYLGSASDEAHDDSAGFANGIRYIREHPMSFLVRGVFKTTYLLTSDTDGLSAELADAVAAGQFDRYCWLALVTQAVWMVFLVAVCMGVHNCLSSLPWKDAGGVLLVGILMYWLAIHFVFFGAGRFHMPIVPVMAASAGLALTRLSAGQELPGSS